MKRIAIFVLFLSIFFSYASADAQWIDVGSCRFLVPYTFAHHDQLSKQIGYDVYVDDNGDLLCVTVLLQYDDPLYSNGGELAIAVKNIFESFGETKDEAEVIRVDECAAIRVIDGDTLTVYVINRYDITAFSVISSSPERLYNHKYSTLQTIFAAETPIQ